MPAISAAPDPSGSRRWEFGAVRLDERGLELRVDGQAVALELKSRAVLRHLLHHAGEVVTRDELLDAVWPGRIVTESVLNKCVSKLRAAIGDQAHATIRTLHGLGYRLDAPVRVRQIESAASPLRLKAGDTPPLRPHWRLQQRLGLGGRVEAWLGRQEKSGELRVFKFARDADALGSLKREITLFRVLRESLGERDDLRAILDWNLDEPPCYLECEYLPAGDLRHWCAGHGGAASLPLAARLELIARLADSLAAAHSVGVLHKDLKPHNVLVAESDDSALPTLKLADFGSGGVIDRERLGALGITQMGFTRALERPGSSSGTPLYLAPEVLTGQPATMKGDVYALGVMLYQFVVGDIDRPLASGWEDEIDDELLREDIAAAVHGDPQRRLGDAAGLAQRLRALPARRRERAQQRAAQQRAGRALQARRELRRLRVVALLMLALAGLASYAGLSARQAGDESRASEAAAVIARDAAEQAATRARVVSDFMNQELLGGAAWLDEPESISLRQILDQISGRIDAQLADYPQAAAELHYVLGDRFLNDRARALHHFARAASLYEQALGAAANETLAARSRLAYKQAASGEAAAAARSYARIADALAARYGPMHLLALNAAVPRQFTRAFSADFAAAYAALGQIAARLERADEAVTLDSAFARRLYGTDEPARFRLAALASAQRHRALLAQRMESDLAGATAAAEQALVLARRVHGAESPGALEMYPPAMLLHAQQGQFVRAGQLRDASLALARKLFADDGHMAQFFDFLIGRVALEQGDFRRAAEALGSFVDYCGTASRCSAMYLRYHEREMLARSQLERGALDAASAGYQQALALRSADLGPASPWTIIARLGLADARLRRGEMAAAEAMLATVDARMLAKIPADSLHRADYLRLRGQLAGARGDRQAARADLAAAQGLFEAALEPGHWRLRQLVSLREAGSGQK